MRSTELSIDSVYRANSNIHRRIPRSNDGRRTESRASRFSGRGSLSAIPPLHEIDASISVINGRVTATRARDGEQYESPRLTDTVPIQAQDLRNRAYTCPRVEHASHRSDVSAVSRKIVKFHIIEDFHSSHRVSSRDSFDNCFRTILFEFLISVPVIDLEIHFID